MAEDTSAIEWQTLTFSLKKENFK